RMPITVVLSMVPPWRLLEHHFPTLLGLLFRDFTFVGADSVGASVGGGGGRLGGSSFAVVLAQ
ncbi:hypothetical protein, partial [Stenotrophomonas maltophilia]|uniref:hypothetical protein n=1 Tax=Stenotrophomonas maltophilia TaxID=40324 RepID=UPI001953C4E4